MRLHPGVGALIVETTPEPYDALLAARFPDAPWLVLSPLPAPATGHADLDALFLALDQLAPREAVEAAARSLAEDSRRPEIRAACARWLDRITSDRSPSRPSPAALAELDEAARARAHQRMALSHAPQEQRRRLAENLARLLLAEPDEPTCRLALSWLARPCDPGAWDALAGALTGALRRAPSAVGGVFDALAQRLGPGDPLAPIAVEALVVRDGIGAAPAIRRAIQEAASDWDRARLAVRVVKCKAEVDYDREPAWVDVLFPGVVHLPWAIELTYPLTTARTSAPLLRALRHDYAPSLLEAHWADLLASLARVDDPSCVAQLEELARELPEAPKGMRLQRSKNAVLALVKRLKRRREVIDAASFVVEPGVGTDGGPILVVAKDAARKWAGAPPGWDGSGSDSDYDRACACSEGGLGALPVDGRAALVVDEQAVQVARLAPGELLLVASGTDLQVEAMLRDRRAFKKTAIAVDVADEGLVLLDAARTLDRAGDGAALTVALPQGRYKVFEARRDEPAGRVRVLRLLAR